MSYPFLSPRSSTPPATVVSPPLSPRLRRKRSPRPVARSVQHNASRVTEPRAVVADRPVGARQCSPRQLTARVRLLLFLSPLSPRRQENPPFVPLFSRRHLYARRPSCAAWLSASTSSVSLAPPATCARPLAPRRAACHLPPPYLYGRLNYLRWTRATVAPIFFSYPERRARASLFSLMSLCKRLIHGNIFSKNCEPARVCA